MTGNTSPTSDELNAVKQETVHWPAKALRVTIVDSDGNEYTTEVPVTTQAKVYEERRAYNTDNQVEYIGEAEPGTEDTADSWRIQKRTYVNNRLTKISWADYNAEFDKVWDDRDTYDYR